MSAQFQRQRRRKKIVPSITEGSHGHKGSHTHLLYGWHQGSYLMYLLATKLEAGKASTWTKTASFGSTQTLHDGPAVRHQEPANNKGCPTRAACYSNTATGMPAQCTRMVAEGDATALAHLVTNTPSCQSPPNLPFAGDQLRERGRQVKERQNKNQECDKEVMRGRPDS